MGLYVAVLCGFGIQHATYDASEPVFGTIVMNFEAFPSLKIIDFRRTVVIFQVFGICFCMPHLMALCILLGPLGGSENLVLGGLLATSWGILGLLGSISPALGAIMAATWAQQAAQESPRGARGPSRGGFGDPKASSWQPFRGLGLLEPSWRPLGANKPSISPPESPQGSQVAFLLHIAVLID